jgi:hypothetical protein
MDASIPRISVGDACLQFQRPRERRLLAEWRAERSLAKKCDAPSAFANFSPASHRLSRNHPANQEIPESNVSILV